VYLLGVKPCPTTIRGGSADTCKKKRTTASRTQSIRSSQAESSAFRSRLLGVRRRLEAMVEGGILTTLSDVVVGVALVVAIVVGALFVSGRIAPPTENTEPEGDNDES
jgi:hypothetical protein